jgi:hypothetical protein
MTEKFKIRIILTLLTLVFLPFIFITDFFPFMRFGMFAEPVKTDVQMEYFKVYVKDSLKISPLEPSELKISENNIFYLCRNYYYRGESDLFLKRLSDISSYKDKEWQLYRFQADIKNPASKDSTLVTSFR